MMCKHICSQMNVAIAAVIAGVLGTGVLFSHVFPCVPVFPCPGQKPLAQIVGRWRYEGVCAVLAGLLAFGKGTVAVHCRSSR